MKRTICVAVAFACLLCMASCLPACQSRNVQLNEEKSYFSDFKVENDKVYIYCTLFIENSADDEKIIELKATLNDDAENGLLKEAVIDGYSRDEATKNFTLQKGESRIDVVFIGEYAGTDEKLNRLLPDIEIIPIE